MKRYGFRSVCLSQHQPFAAVGPAGGDIDRLLQQRRANAGSATLSAYVGSWTQTCLSSVATGSYNMCGLRWFCLSCHTCVHSMSQSQNNASRYQQLYTSICIWPLFLLSIISRRQVFMWYAGKSENITNWLEGNMSAIHRLYTVRQKKGTTFLLWINLLIHNVIWQDVVLLLLMNIIVDVTYLISGIYTKFRRLLCKSVMWVLRH